MWPTLANLVRFTEEILDRKPHTLCRASLCRASCFQHHSLLNGSFQFLFTNIRNQDGSPKEAVKKISYDVYKSNDDMDLAWHLIVEI